MTVMTTTLASALSYSIFFLRVTDRVANIIDAVRVRWGGGTHSLAV
jgi:hypothetical protein